MASSSEPRILAFIAGGAISKGMAVKIGADDKHVVVGSANTDRCIGIAQCDAAASGDTVEVALPGGGGKALLGEGVSAGNDLCSHTDGTLVKVNNAGDQIVCRAMQDGSSADIIAVEVYFAPAAAAQ